MPENKKLKGTISANGLSVRTILSSDGDDYISLTDLAKFKRVNHKTCGIRIA